MKYFWTALVSCLATLIILGVGGYFFIRSQSPFCVNKAESGLSIFVNKKDEIPETCEIKPPQKLKMYVDEEERFSFQYPEQISLDGQIKGRETLKVGVDKIKEIGDQPLGWDQDTAESDILSLKYDDPSVGINFGNIESYKMLDIKGAKGKEFVTLSMFDVCDVQFSHYAVVYRDDYRVVISLKMNDVEGAKNETMDYLTTDDESCYGEYIWKDQGVFYKDVEAGLVKSKKVNDWMDDFETIIETFRIEE